MEYFGLTGCGVLNAGLKILTEGLTLIYDFSGHFILSLPAANTNVLWKIVARIAIPCRTSLLRFRDNGLALGVETTSYQMDGI